jgi:hypothetical protein
MKILMFVFLAAAAFGEAERIEVGPTWSGCVVRQCFATRAGWQYVAYYDADRVMTFAQRPLTTNRWISAKLPSKFGWDSHNYVTMAFDSAGYLHLSGNMHGAPLVYFRSETPATNAPVKLVRVPAMVGKDERHVTYPEFLHLPDGTFFFTYRDGGSGNGNQLINRYDPAAAKWSRLTTAPVFDGRGEMNAYPNSPVFGPDGFFHVLWVWRDTPDCSSNHDISYARTRDFEHWENIAGKPLRLPIRLGDDVVVDAVPPKGGLLNGFSRTGFDAAGRVIVSYMKYDAKGVNQIYNARWRDGGGWQAVQASSWTNRCEFSGGGCIPPIGISFSEVKLGGGALEQSFSNKDSGGRWAIDPETLRVIGRAKGRPSFSLPPECYRMERKEPEMEMNREWDVCANPATHRSDDGSVWVLEWESRLPNRDRPYPGPIPAPSTLRLWRMHN